MNNKKRIVILGAGRIGIAVYNILYSKNFDLLLIAKEINKKQNIPVDAFKDLNINNTVEINKIISGFRPVALVNCLPFYLTGLAVAYAADNNLHYFDVTEDVESGKIVKEISQGLNKAFIPHNGVAPGLVNIISGHLAKQFDELYHLEAKCGVLPLFTYNSLKYGTTWSIEGLVNQYCNKCLVIKNGKAEEVDALDNLQNLIIDGVQYESFNTSGGSGTLVESFAGRVRNLSYQTIRYPGHRDLISFLLMDLKLSNRRKLIVEILTKSLPITTEDITLIMIKASGLVEGEYKELSYIKKIYFGTLPNGDHATSIQLITASTLCAVVEEVINNEHNYKGFIKQEDLNFEIIKKNSIIHL